MGIINLRNLCKRFIKENEEIKALDGINISIRANTLTCILGADGAGKTTLLRSLACVLRIDGGELDILGKTIKADMPERAYRSIQSYIHDNISYMPQKFGLYEDLSIQENIDLYASLHGLTESAKKDKQEELMQMTGLTGFENRLCKNLSGGMKQKLALIVSLMKVPKILLLDEPTVGVDPLSRKELWEILEKLISDEDITVLVSTSYMDEAEIADMVLMLDNGKVILDAPPDDMRKKAEGMSYNISAEDCPVLREAFYEVSTAPGVMDIVPAGGGLHFISTDISYLEKYHPKPVKPSVEDGFMTVLKYNPSHGLSASANFARKRKDEVIIEAKGLVKKFGDFTAVNSTSFTVTRGEIFGLLGPNGAGKTTTFRMMCGLIPPTEGDLKVVGIDAKKAALEVRKRLGYMAQKFSLYQDLTVIENLDFFASAYALRTEQKHDRIESVVKQFDLGKALNWQTKTLPGGFKQRLSMAVALLHNPEILFLDEPTSGADPVARREFWRTILRLSDGGTTIIVTTHFMEEAEYCDKVMIQDHGNMLAIGTPKEIRGKAEGASNMNDAFIKIIEKARDEH